jgi:hypothetical protein
VSFTWAAPVGLFKRRHWLFIIVLVVLAAGGWAMADKLGRIARVHPIRILAALPLTLPLAA